MADEKRPLIVIKRVKKGGHDGHHGGAWKVAYADFVTAMMAFFLLMWLLNAASQEQKEAIAYYFSTGEVINSSNSGGETILPGVIEATGQVPVSSPFVGFDGSRVMPDLSDKKQKYLANKEQELFDRAKIALEEAIASDPELLELRDNLVITKTEEGLNIQLIDQANQSVFTSGSDVLTPNGRRLTVLLAKVLRQMPQEIAIEGHTDAVPFTTRNGYSNWELSADRALAFRRRMISLGIDEAHIVRVAGQASMKPYVLDNPEAPQNRRISMTLLSSFRDEAIREARKAALEAMRAAQVPARDAGK